MLLDAISGNRNREMATQPTVVNSADTSSCSSFLLAVAKWAVESDLFLDAFVENRRLPHLALVTKGQHLQIGAPNVASPQLKPYVIVHSQQRVRKLIGRLVRTKDGGRRRLLTDQRVAISETFSGYFEILSEDGHPVKCLESVMELCDKFPDQCLVRQTAKAYLPETDGELRTVYRTRNIQEGEILTLVGQFNLKTAVFLRCFDESGCSVYLKLNQKGRFSPVARPEAITGVHSAANLMTKRMPIAVKLVQGECPPSLIKAAGGGTVTLRLENVVHEDVVFVYPLHRDEDRCVIVPLKAHLKLAPALNASQVRNRSDFQALCGRCDDAVSAAQQRDQMVAIGHADPPSTAPSNAETTTAATEKTTTSVVVSDEEIEQLYDYIRGYGPPPSTGKEKKKRPFDKEKQRPSKNTPKPPTPPPIETMPGRRNTPTMGSNSTSDESRQRHQSGRKSSNNVTQKQQQTTVEVESNNEALRKLSAKFTQEPQSSANDNPTSSNSKPQKEPSPNRSCKVAPPKDAHTPQRRPEEPRLRPKLERHVSKSTEDLKQKQTPRRAAGCPAARSAAARAHPPPSHPSPYAVASATGHPPMLRRRPVSMVLPENVAFSPHFYGPTTVFVHQGGPLPYGPPPGMVLQEPPPPYTGFGGHQPPPTAIIKRFVPHYAPVPSQADHR